MDLDKFNEKVSDILDGYDGFQPQPSVAATSKHLETRDLSSIPTKVCEMCDAELPLHQDFFHVDSSKPDGFRNVCKGCRNLHIQSQKVQKHSEAIDKFKAKLSTHVVDHAENVATATGRRDNVGKMYESILNAFGGVEMFGATVADVFLRSTTTTQQKLIANITSMSKSVTEMGLADKNLEDMTEEELLQELNRRARAAGFSKIAEDAKNKLQEIKDKDNTKHIEQQKVIPIESQVVQHATVIGETNREMSYAERTKMMGEIAEDG